MQQQSLNENRRGAVCETFATSFSRFYTFYWEDVLPDRNVLK